VDAEVGLQMNKLMHIFLILIIATFTISTTPKKDMKYFDPDLIRPIGGVISAVIFENKHIGIPKTLFYNIQIDLKNMIISEDTIATVISLEFITMNIRSLKELENKSFDFPINPTDGYIDGSMYLFSAHNPFDVTRIEFGSISGNMIQATFYYSIDFEFEGTGYLKTKDLKLITSLKFGNLSIDPDILKPKKANFEKSKKLLSDFTEVLDYGLPKIDGDRIVFEMNIKK
jgi:hypothetical protein